MYSNNNNNSFILIYYNYFVFPCKLYLYESGKVFFKFEKIVLKKLIIF